MGLTAIAYAMQLLTSLPQLIQAGTDAMSLINHGREKLSEMQTAGRDPTQEEWDELNAKIKALQDELHS